MRVAKHQVFKLTQDVVAALRQMRQIQLLRLICACGAQMGEREQQVDFFAQLRFISGQTGIAASLSNLF